MVSDGGFDDLSDRPGSIVTCFDCFIDVAATQSVEDTVDEVVSMNLRAGDNGRIAQ